MSQKRSAEAALAQAPAKKNAFEASIDQRAGVPVGWRQCPPYATFPELRVVACKVPLGAHWSKELIAEADQFTPEMLLAQLQEQNIYVGMVIDLTNSRRYYDFEDATGTSDFQYPDGQKVFHRKIQCKGRGQAPSPAAVNEFCWCLSSFNYHIEQGQEETKLWTIVHCTHGFNRTGFMYVNALLRMKGRTVNGALRSFAETRPPGIYKRHYIEELYKYNHTKRPSNFHFPRLPSWKEADEDDLLDAAQVAPEGAPEPARMHHDDEIGEEVDEEEAEAVQAQVVSAILGPAAQELRFPGSQPVSLAASNIHLLKKHRYYVTWKADGTRYMLYISSLGTYLVDRSFKVRRVQMRWPTSARPGHNPAFNPAVLHNGTLLDGEMVVDEEKDTHKQTRRYLAYDMIQVMAQSLKFKEFKERMWMIDMAVVLPRNAERDAMRRDLGRPPQQRRMQTHYLYPDEPFSVRKKEFWRLDKAGDLMNIFIPEKVLHEADGLILQPWVGERSHYIPNTCEEVLKWKFAHLNSVDFRFWLVPGGGATLSLLTRNGENPIHDAKVSFPDHDAAKHNGQIIECSWDAQKKSWVYMRERRDKSTPNAWRVYDKVVQSIKDNITPSHLLDIIADATRDNDLYTAAEKPSSSKVAPKSGHQQTAKPTGKPAADQPSTSKMAHSNGSQAGAKQMVQSAAGTVDHPKEGQLNGHQQDAKPKVGTAAKEPTSPRSAQGLGPQNNAEPKAVPAAAVVSNAEGAEPVGLQGTAQPTVEPAAAVLSTAQQTVKAAAAVLSNLADGEPDGPHHKAQPEVAAAAEVPNTSQAGEEQ